VRDGVFYGRTDGGLRWFSPCTVGRWRVVGRCFWGILVSVNLRAQGPEEVHGAAAVAEVGGAAEGAFDVGLGGGDGGQGLVA